MLHSVFEVALLRSTCVNIAVCLQLDPFGALSLKSEHVFTAEDKVLQLSLRKPDIGKLAVALQYLIQLQELYSSRIC